MIFHAIGLMSGTSIDGLDICYCRFEKNSDKWYFEILKTETLPYSEMWEEKLRHSIDMKSDELLALHSEYGFYLGEKVQEFIHCHSLKNIDLIASHGHTVFHQPQKKITLQIGDGRAIKILNKIPVVYDFRSQDVLMGGNGAPLVPIGDELLFSEFDACLNIGGFSNISFNKDGKRIAFDISPVNIVLNKFAKNLGKSYDENGDFARKGSVDKQLSTQLNALKFYHENPPKSLGAEWVNENVLPLMKHQKPEDLLATFTEHSAVQIANVFENYDIKTVLITGGGTYNNYLIEKLNAKTKTQIHIPKPEIINYKEALIFAFMGVLRMNSEINVLASATGSSANHLSGLVV